MFSKYVVRRCRFAKVCTKALGIKALGTKALGTLRASIFFNP